MISKSEQRFVRLNGFTILFTLLLILAGGIVRSTGSGMGCPDWPKCFGQYIPPTSIDQLPLGYEHHFIEERLKKNERFARSLEKLGKVELAKKIREDKTLVQPESFNAAKTWTEYINRLTGAITGVLLLAIAGYAFIYRKTATRIFVLSIINLIVVVFQAWLGSIVVSTNLLAWVVTVHMLLALVLLAILVYTYDYARQRMKAPMVVIAKVDWLKVLIFVAIAVNVYQIVIGTEVREQIDFISKNLEFQQRSTWVSRVGSLFQNHRNLGILLAVLTVLVYKFVTDKFSGKATAIKVSNAIIIVLLVQMVTGFLLSNFALPPFAQAMHILFSTALFTLQYYLYLLVYRANTYNQ
jgi:cytochrome c oxidase assembly protein subunit 15